MRFHQVASLRAKAPLLGLLASVLFLSTALVSLSSGQPAKDTGTVKDQKRNTVTYDVSDIAEREEHGIDNLVLMLMRTIKPEDWRKGVNTLQVVNESKLVIHAPAALHKEIADYVATIRRVWNTDVIVEGKLYEVGRDVYVNKIKPLLSKQSEEKSMDELLKRLSTQATLVQSGEAKIHDRHEGRFLSFRQAYLFKRWSESRFPNDLKDKAYELGFHGVTFKAKVFPTADRLRVGLRLSEHATQLQDMKTEKDFNLETGKDELMDFPHTLEQTSTLPLEDVEDGRPIVRNLTWKSREARAKDREMVLVVRPVIYVEEEEQERRKRAEEKK